MKKLLIALLALSSCTQPDKKTTPVAAAPKPVALTPEQKYKKAISAFLSTSMHDYSSYQPVEYAKLDSSYSFYENSDVYKHDNKRENAIQAESKGLDESNLTLKQKSEKLKKIIDSAQFYMAKMKRDRKSFVPEFNGFKITHKYRGKNVLGALVLNNSVFYLDTTLTKVVGLSEAK